MAAAAAVQEVSGAAFGNVLGGGQGLGRGKEGRNDCHARTELQMKTLRSLLGKGRRARGPYQEGKANLPGQSGQIQCEPLLKQKHRSKIVGSI